MKEHAKKPLSGARLNMLIRYTSGHEEPWLQEVHQALRELKSARARKPRIPRRAQAGSTVIGHAFVGTGITCEKSGCGWPKENHE